MQIYLITISESVPSNEISSRPSVAIFKTHDMSIRQTENFSIYRRHKLLAMSSSSPICLEWICIVIRPHVGDG